MTKHKGFLISEDFLNDDKIRIFMKMPHSRDAFYVLVRMLGLAAKSNAGGFLMLDKRIPYDVEFIAMLIDMEVTEVQLAIDLLIKFNLIKETEQGFMIEDYMNFLTDDSKYLEQGRLRAKKNRERKKLELSAPAGVEKEVAATVEKPKKKKEKRIYESGSIELELAEYLFEKMLHNNPDAKKPNFQSWADDVRKMIEIDKRKPEHVRNMIDWSQNDTFWKTNILSCKKLRDKFDQMRVRAIEEIKRDRAGGNRKVQEVDNVFDEIMREEGKNNDEPRTRIVGNQSNYTLLS